MSKENDLLQVEIDRNLIEQQITIERGPDEVIAYPSQGVFVVPPEKFGPMKFPMGLSGSLTRLVDGTPYILAGENITITTGSKGQITISAEGGTGGSGGGGGSGAVATSVEWKTYTPTIGVITGTSPTISVEPACYLRGRYVTQGKMMTLLFSMSGVGAGASIGNGTYTISLPSTFSIDTSLITLGTSANQFLNGTSVGTASIVMNTSTSGGGWAVIPVTSTTLILVGQNASQTASPVYWASNSHPFNGFGTTYRISFVANVPLA